MTQLDLSGNSIATLPAGAFSGLDSLTALDLSGNSIATLLAGAFSGLDSLTQIDLAGNSLATLPAGAFSGLDSVTQINLAGNSLTTLQAGIFSGVPGLLSLNLSGNSIAAPPLNIFSDLTALTTFDLSSNSLTTLPAGAFNTLPALISLDLSDNDIPVLPYDTFKDLTTALTSLDLSDQTAADVGMQVHLYLTQDGNEVTATLPSGAPADLTLNLSVSSSGGGAATTRTLDIDTGETTASITLVPTGSETLTASFDSTTPVTHDALTLTGADILPAVDPVLDFCNRTPNVRDGLLALTSIDDCRLVTYSVLAGISTTLDLSSMSIATLQANDFNGLSSLTQIDLSDNSIATLPAGLFSGLDSVTQISLAGNSIETLSESLFSGVPGLLSINLATNSIATLPESIFSGVPKLVSLNLSDNSLTALPAGIFDGLSNLVNLDLHHNSLATLPARVFSGLSNLDTPNLIINLNLNNNELTDLPDDTFTDLTRALATLNLSSQTDANNATPMRLNLSQVDNTVTATIPSGTFATTTVNLTVSSDDANVADITQTISIAVGQTSASITLVPTSSDTLTAALANPPLTFTGITPAGLVVPTPGNELVAGFCSRAAEVQAAIITAIAAIDSSPAKTCAHVSSADLAALHTLDLSGNSLTSLLAADFDGLTAVNTLDLSGNSLTTLPAGAFNSITTLRSLDLSDNDMPSLPDDTFKGLNSALTSLNLSDQTDADVNMKVYLYLTQDGNEVTATLPSGSPAAMKVNLIISSDAPGSTPTAGTILLRIGRTSNTLTLVPSGSETLTADFRSTNPLTASTLPITLTGATISPTASPVPGFCDRTAGVRDGVLAVVSTDDCLRVTYPMLAGLSTLDLSVAAGATATITSLKRSDFENMTAVSTLNLQNQGLSTLPAGVFNELGALTNLDLSGNEFTDLPDDTFKDLATALTTLDLSKQTDANADTPMRLNLSQADNTVTATIPAGAFATTTVNLTVSSDDADVADITQTIGIPLGQTSASITLVPTSGDTLTAALANPALTFAGITPTGLVVPTTGNELVAGFCSRTAEVRAAIITAIGGSPAKTCAHVSSADLAAITALDLENDGITTLQLGDFAGLTTLTALDLSGNSLTTLPAGTLNTMQASALNTMQASAFNGLTALTILDLSDNSLDTMPEGAFSGLTALTALDLSDNSLTTIQAGAFNELTALTILDLSDNDMPILPDGTFEGFAATPSGLLSLDLSDQTDGDVNMKIYLYLDQDSDHKVTATLPAGAPAELTVNLTVSSDDANVADITQTITLPLGQTSASTTLMPTSGDTLTAAFDSTTAVTHSTLTLTGADILPAVDPVPGFCDRTPGVRDGVLALVSTDDCNRVTYPMLAAISTLDLSVASGATATISSLQRSDFEDLHGVTNLTLQNQGLSTLPAGVFNELGALAVLNLSGNNIATLPDNTFTGFPSTLTELSVGNQTSADSNMNIRVYLKQVGTTVTATLPASSFTATDVNLSITDSGGNEVDTPSISLATGATSDTLTLSDAAQTANFASTNVLTYTGTPTPTLSGATIVPTVQVPGFCDRTAAVRDAILATTAAAAANNNCAEVSADMLAAITAFDLADSGITALKDGDFGGLTALQTLDLNDNSISALPEDLFDDLTALQTLSLHNNSLGTLPVDLFDGITALQTLNLNDNSISTLPEGVFDGLTALTHLDLDANSLSALPVDLFDGPTALQTLNLDSNSITSAGLPDGVFDGLSALTRLDLDANSLSTMPAAIFDDLTGLQTLSLRNNSITSAGLPAGVFDSLTALTHLDLGSNTISAPLAGIFANLSSLQTLLLYSNGLTSLRAGVFDGLSSLETLWLHENNLTTMPAGLFKDLTALTELDLSNNSILTLPDDSFTGFTATLDTLKLQAQTDADVDMKVLLYLHQVGNLVTASIPSGAPAALTVTLSVTSNGGAAASTATIGIPVGGTSNSITLTPAGSETLTAAFATIPAALGITTLTGLAYETFSEQLGGFCRRTAAVRNAILAHASVAATSCHTVTSADLAAITDSLKVPISGDSTISALRPGDFDGLTELRALDLSGNSISALPEGIFDELTDLSTLDLSGNGISALPAGTFDSPTALTTLDLSDNSLTDLPAGIFNALTDLATLDLSGNSIATLPDNTFTGLTRPLTTLSVGKQTSADSNMNIRLYLHQVGNRVTATIPAGAPANLSVDLSVSSSAPSSTPSSDAIVIHVGHTSNHIVLTPQVGETLTADFAATPLSHTGLTLNGATFDPVVQAAGFCDRTPAVRDAILALISGTSDCARVNPTLLGNLTGHLQISSASGQPSTLPDGLRAGDLDGLFGISQLSLNHQGLTTLPPRIFKDLRALTALNLQNNALTTLPDDSFTDFPGTLSTLLLNLQPGTNDTTQMNLFLRQHGNRVTATVPSGTPAPLRVNLVVSSSDPDIEDTTAMIDLAQGGTSDSITLTPSGSDTLTATFAATDAAIFTTTFTNQMGPDIVTTLATGVCDRTVQVQDLLLAELSGVSDCADVTGAHLDTISAALSTLDLNDKSITALKPNDFAGLDVTTLDLGNNQLTTLPLGVFDGLSNLSTLSLNDNRLTALPLGIFDGLSNLSTLSLNHNQLGTGALAAGALPVGVFSGLSNLSTLNLSHNQLTTLPSGTFNGLSSSITSLNLGSNQIQTLAPGLFSELGSFFLTLSNNFNFVTLPDGLFQGISANLSGINLTPLIEQYARINVFLRQNSDNTVTVTIPAATFAETTVHLTVTDGGAIGTKDIVIPVGQTTHTTTETLSGTAPIAAFRDANPVSISSDTGTAQGFVFAPRLSGICDRTPAVRTVLLATLSADDCAAVTDAMLNAITGTLDLSGMGISSLRDQDFAGLTQINGLDLSRNALTELSNTLFADLGKVATLDLSDNQLYPTQSASSSENWARRAFGPLQSLTRLDLSGNEFHLLPESFFANTPATLTSVDLRAQFRNSVKTTIASLDLPVTLSLSSVDAMTSEATATLSLPAGAPVPLTFPLTLDGAASGSANSIGIARNATSATLTLTQATGETLTAALDSTNLPTLTGMQGLRLVSVAAGICDRTQQVQDALVAAISSAATCADVTLNNLHDLITLNLSNKGISSLQAGDFHDLPSLTTLDLSANALTTLPPNVFDGTRPTALYLNDNKLSTLPPLVFRPLHRLHTLRLHENEFTTVPAGFFVGLDSPLSQLDMRDQFEDNPDSDGTDTPTAAAKIALTLMQRGNQVTVSVPAGAPFDMTVNLAITGGAAQSGSPHSVFVRHGQTSGSTTLLPVAGQTLTADFAATPVTNPASIYVAYQPQKLALGICSRSAAVQAAIIAAPQVTATTCGAVTDAMLNAITGTLDLADAGIGSLQAGDFAALTGLTGLNLSGALAAGAALPAGAFDDLIALTTLDLSDNSLTALPASIFNNLSALTSLDLSGNSLTALPASIFNNLGTVTSLDLSGNRLTAGALDSGDPAASFFAPLIALTTLNLSDNALTALPDGLFAGLTVALTNLDLSSQNDSNGKALGGNLKMSLQPSWDSGTNRVTLDVPAGVPAALSVTLAVTDSGVASGTRTLTVPAGATSVSASQTGTAVTLGSSSTPPSWADGTTGTPTIKGLDFTFGICNRTMQVQARLLARVRLLTGVDSNIGCGSVTDTMLATLGTASSSNPGGGGGSILDLSGDALINAGLTPITALQANDFAGLSGINTLYLQGNELTELPAVVFNGLTAVTSVSLQENQIATITPGVFKPMPLSSGIDLSSNELAALPKDLFTGRTAGMGGLALGNQFGNMGSEIHIPVFLLQDGNRLTATLPPGAPNALTVNLTITSSPGNATSTQSIVIPVGQTTGTATLTPATGQTQRASFASSNPFSHSSLTLLGGQFVGQTLGICGRSPAVQAAIIAAPQVTTNDCGAVTDEVLSAITGTLDLSGSISALQAGDLAGLTGLTGLNLSGNGLTALTAGIFDDLGAVTTLDLSGNALAAGALTAGDSATSIFVPLVALTSLDLSDNWIAELPAGIFAGLSVPLTNLDLRTQRDFDGNTSSGNLPLNLMPAWNSGTGMITVTAPAGVPAALTVPLSVTVDGGSPSTSTLTVPAGATSASISQTGTTVALAGGATAPSWASGSTIRGIDFTFGICDRTAEIQAFLLTRVPATTCGAVTDAMLSNIRGITNIGGSALDGLGIPRLTSLQANDFAGLSGVTTLYLFANDLTHLPAGVFNGLTSTTFISVAGNQIATIAPGAFNGLPALDVDKYRTEQIARPAQRSLHRHDQINSGPLYGQPVRRR